MPGSELACSYRRYRLALREPLRAAFGTIAHRDGFVVRVTDEAGLVGFGEVAPLPEYAGEGMGEAEKALAEMARWLASGPADFGGVSRDEHAVLAKLSREMSRLWQSKPAARSGMTFALADLFARRARLPLARWLNPDAVASVAVNGTIGAVAPADAASAAAGMATEGFRTFKIKLDADVEASVARVAAVRDAVVAARSGEGAVASRQGGEAEEVALRGDANGAWDVPSAFAALEALAVCELQYVEQPVAAGDVAGLARLRREAQVPVAADEALLLPGGADRVLDMNAADVYVLKPSLMGGPVEALDLATRAVEAGADVVVTSAFEGAIGRECGLHVAAAAPGPVLACGLATGSLFDVDLAQGTLPARGAMRLPDQIGLGLDVPPGLLPG